MFQGYLPDTFTVSGLHGCRCGYTLCNCGPGSLTTTAHTTNVVVFRIVPPQETSEERELRKLFEELHFRRESWRQAAPPEAPREAPRPRAARALVPFESRAFLVHRQRAVHRCNPSRKAQLHA